MSQFAAHLVLAIGLVVAPLVVNAETAPRPLAADSRIRHIAYNPNEVVEIVGTFGYQTSIEFAGNEEIKVVTLGDTIAWQTVPYQNQLFIKPVEANATTNLTVITNRRKYLFRLRSARNPATATYVVRFRYPEGMQAYSAGGAAGVAASKINTRYTVVGTRKAKRAIQVEQIFDDGQFTYFEFKPDTDVPAIYVVNADNSEAMTNVRREGQYLVVERLSDTFALRVDNSRLRVSRPEKRS